MTLAVRDLAVARGGVTVLEGIGFALPEGQALVLRGPNGVGKTTLLRTLAGLQPAVAGEISMPPEALAYGAHADGIKAVLTVAENLAFWAAVHGTVGIDPALRAMDLVGLRDRRAAHLSAGQKRRLGLARLLVTGRPVKHLRELIAARLLDEAETGELWVHDWRQWQDRWCNPIERRWDILTAQQRFQIDPGSVV